MPISVLMESQEAVVARPDIGVNDISKEFDYTQRDTHNSDAIVRIGRPADVSPLFPKISIAAFCVLRTTKPWLNTER